VLALDPTLGNARLDLVRAHMLRGDLRRALELLESNEDSDRSFSDGVLWARLAVWYPETAPRLNRFEVPADVRRLSPWFTLSVAKRIRRGESVEEDLLEMERYVTAGARSRRLSTLFQQLLAEYRATLGRSEDALLHVERAVDCGLFDLGWLDGCPVLSSIRGTEQFAALRAKVAARAQPVVDVFA
jgi:tetratricopeptide (TPR) repeat protein